MNTHTVQHHHLDWHWMNIMGHRLNLAIHNPKVWAVVGVLALISAFIAMAMIAGNVESEPMSPYLNEFPGYPPVAP
jgi:hypothetical protein